MALSIRFYLFTQDGLQRLSKRLMEGLVHGTDSMPQFAGTKQKVADVYLEVEQGKAIRLDEARGHFLTFDKKGQVHNSLRASGFGAMETMHDLKEASRKSGSSKVVDLSPQLKRDKWERENRWTLSKQDLDAIADDIWGRGRAKSPKAQQAKGTAPKPVPLTYEAKEVLAKLHVSVSTITVQLEDLTDPALKGLAYEAHQLAEGGSAIWRGIAEAIDRRREILSRYRTGKGIWYACVDLVQWDDLRRSGETNASFHEKCNSKAEAEVAAQRLLAENSKYFRSYMSVEARVYCDLEWLEERAEDEADLEEENEIDGGTSHDT